MEGDTAEKGGEERIKKRVLVVPYLEYGGMFRSAYFVLWPELKIQNEFGK